MRRERQEERKEGAKDKTLKDRNKCSEITKQKTVSDERSR